MVEARPVVRRHSDKEAQFWRKLTSSQEDRWQRGHPLWDGVGYRWFKASNIFCFEHYRRPDPPQAEEPARLSR